MKDSKAKAIAEITNVVLANQKRKVTITEIAKCTGIDRHKVSNLVKKDDELSKYVVDGRKLGKPELQLINPNDSRISAYFNLSDEEISKVVVKAEECDENTKESLNEDAKEVLKKDADEATDISTNAISYENTDKTSDESTDQKKKVKYSSLVKQGVIKEYIIDYDAEWCIEDFIYFIRSLVSEKIIPKILLFANDVLKLDLAKKENKLASEMLKFFAQDKNENFHILKCEDRPNLGEKLAKMCKENNFTLISGNPKNVAWCKLYDVEVVIPQVYKERYPNPFKGKGIIGLDSCMMGIKHNEMANLLSQFETCLISNIQLKEMRGGYLFIVSAYYGQIKWADRQFEDEDKNIAYFYQKNTVNTMYTIDYGCYLFAALAKVNCKLYKDKRATESMMLKILDNGVFVEWENLKKGDEIILDEIPSPKDRGYLDFKGYPYVSIYRSSGLKRRDKRGYSQDYIFIKNNDKIIIAQITKLKLAVIKFCGNTDSIPEEYNF